MHQLKTRAQFQAAMAGGIVSRTTHFALHRLVLCARDAPTQQPPPGPDSSQTAQEPQALFGVPGPWLGGMAPKRWARRAVTRNAIKRQIQAVAATFEPRMPSAAFVVRLRAGFDRKQFKSASSDHLKQAVRAELEQLFSQALRRSAPAATSGAAP